MNDIPFHRLAKQRTRDDFSLALTYVNLVTITFLLRHCLVQEAFRVCNSRFEYCRDKMKKSRENEANMTQPLTCHRATEASPMVGRREKKYLAQNNRRWKIATLLCNEREKERDGVFLGEK